MSIKDGLSSPAAISRVVAKPKTWLTQATDRCRHRWKGRERQNGGRLHGAGLEKRICGEQKLKGSGEAIVEEVDDPGRKI